jgi:RNA-splicing ligase RtcB
MDELMRVPTIVSGQIMPDACPAGAIPVGAVVAAKNAIHPGFHSEDVCCSVAMTVFNRMDDPTHVMDVAHSVTHFGRGRRARPLYDLGWKIVERMQENRFLSDLVDVAQSALSSQGDGNHFLFVGRRRSDNKLTLVTHHGSRNLGAILYKRGLAAAQRHTRIVSPKTPRNQSWLDADSDVGRAYWEALQIVRQWTKLNHFSIHDAIAILLGNRVIDRFWNEHNFVFRKNDGLFYHAKGSTPAYKGFSADDDGRTLIPLNMGAPILIAGHSGGFAPHGAGRHMSRTAYLKTLDGDPPMPEGVDVRFWAGAPDLSELPGAYKNADQIVAEIQKHKLAPIADYIDPLGTIMAGDEPAPWKKNR